MIKPLWDKYTETLSELGAMLEDFQEGISDKRTAKAFNKLIDHWEKTVSTHNEIDKMIDPIQPIKVNIPFEGKEFAEIWKIYLEGITEKHGDTVSTRQQEVRLRRLKRFSGNNVNRAIAMLEFFTDNGYKGIFNPSEKQLTGDEPNKQEESGTLNLDKKGEL